MPFLSIVIVLMKSQPCQKQWQPYFPVGSMPDMLFHLDGHWSWWEMKTHLAELLKGPEDMKYYSAIRNLDILVRVMLIGYYFHSMAKSWLVANILFWYENHLEVSEFENTLSQTVHVYQYIMLWYGLSGKRPVNH